MAGLEYLKDVVTLDMHADKCIGCGMCLIVCPHSVFSMTNGKAIIENRDACMECGACVKNCAPGALSVQAGVGCVTAVINSLLGRESSSSCCVVENVQEDRDPSSALNQKTNCC